ncbi:CTP synthase [Candidatus Azambacteria bacterium]|nr:CTP synthase [Candidatus Azambacteria bacterium]
MLKYIFIVGGVMSGVGKGVAAASIGKILQSRGFSVTAIKIDPYVNLDAGTMNPTEHGEVFVLNDGMECDQDMGNYERFLDCDLSSANYMTTGSVYQAVINRERNLGYGGKCVEVVPHICLEVLNKIDKAAAKSKANVVIVEIGGTVGEYQNILFLEAIRILKIKKPNDVLLSLVSHLPLQGSEGELKTKPTQYAARTLNAAGLQPDIIIARAPMPLDKKRKDKIAFNCSMAEEDVISAPDVNSIYEVPVNFEKDNLGGVILKKLKLKPKKQDLKDWEKLAEITRRAKNPVKIGIVGKYFGTGDFILADSYISVIEALKHSIYFFKKKPELHWLNADEFSGQDNLKKLSEYDGVVIPGGFGSRGVEGKIAAIRYLREKKIPFLGLCYGMQLAVIEYGRSVLRLKDANTTEINPEVQHPVIDILPEQKKLLEEKNYGGSMRLGAYPAVLKKGTIAYGAYKEHLISERHRHRYEVNPLYVKKLEEKGIVFSGFSPDRRLMEIAELPKKEHPFFVGTQFHPEFKSRPLSPHPLFREFVRAAINKKR